MVLDTQIGVNNSFETASGVITGALTDRGYAVSTIRKRVRLLARLDAWLKVEGMCLEDLDDRAVDRFRTFHQMTYLSAPAGVTSLMVLLRTAQLIPSHPADPSPVGPVELILVQWADYLTRERSLDSDTVRWYLRWGRPFLVSLVHEGTFATLTPTAGDVVCFLTAAIPELPTPHAGGQ